MHTRRWPRRLTSHRLQIVDMMGTSNVGAFVEEVPESAAATRDFARQFRDRAVRVKSEVSESGRQSMRVAFPASRYSPGYGQVTMTFSSIPFGHWLRANSTASPSPPTCAIILAVHAHRRCITGKRYRFGFFASRFPPSSSRNCRPGWGSRRASLWVFALRSIGHVLSSENQKRTSCFGSDSSQ